MTRYHGEMSKPHDGRQYRRERHGDKTACGRFPGHDPRYARYDERPEDKPEVQCDHGAHGRRQPLSTSESELGGPHVPDDDGECNRNQCPAVQAQQPSSSYRDSSLRGVSDKGDCESSFAERPSDVSRPDVATAYPAHIAPAAEANEVVAGRHTPQCVRCRN